MIVSVTALAAIIAFLALFTGDLLTGSEQGRVESIRVTTTTNMITDLVENIGGQRVDVTSLMGPGVDPHLYRPSANDVRKLEGADIVFYNGLDLEGKMGDIFVKIGRGDTRVWAISENIPHDMLLALDQDRNYPDPHIWWDITLWMEAAKVVKQGLSELDPDGADTYQENLDRYLTELEETHAYSVRTIGSIPEDQRVLVTAHDAFQYFGNAYGLEVLAIQGWSTESEAGIKEMQMLADQITNRKIKAIFVETSISPSTIEALRAAVNNRGHNVVIGGELFSDAIGARGTPQGTYVGAFKHNVDTIAEALN